MYIYIIYTYIYIYEFISLNRGFLSPGVPPNLSKSLDHLSTKTTMATWGCPIFKKPEIDGISQKIGT